jgi:hypothetical protein
MKIERSELLADLVDFSLKNSGLIVGKPGIGKSYMIRQLRKSLRSMGVISFLVRIDNIYDSSDAAIQSELGIGEDWIEEFKKVKLSGEQKAVLLFDAFDAARDESLRKGVLMQIKRAKQELQEKWNIIVSVRSYDASKSPELLRLFPANEYDEEALYARRTEIEELTEAEIIEGIGSNDKLLQFYNASSEALKAVLKVPFFLKLLEEIVQHSSAEALEEIKKFSSETQLLESYWKLKIVNRPNYAAMELLLSRFTKLLIKERTLSEAKDKVFTAANPLPPEIFAYLRSENILDEVSMNNTRLAFSHNILFDYAVSVFALTEEYDELVGFIKEDRSRPFFLRPSFVYFFTALWFRKPDVFWSCYWKLRAENIKEIQLFQRLVLNGIIVAEFNRPDELKPILSSPEEAVRVVVIRNLLQSMRFIRNTAEPKDAELLLELSGQLHIAFIFEFGFLLDRSVNLAEDGLKEKCGVAARRFLEFILTKRQEEKIEILDRMGSTRGVELIARTYETDIEQSKGLLRRVIDLLKEPNFEIWYFSNLAEQVKHILPHDPEFVAEIYLVIFNHWETDQSRTQMGSSVIMSFTSNRRQDFEMCHFRLEQFFPTFLSTATGIALPVGMKIANDYVILDRGRFRSEEGMEHFKYGSLECSYFVDLSSIWSDNLAYHKPADFFNNILAIIETFIQEDNPLWEKLLTAYIANAKVGYSWKQLFVLAEKYPKKLHPQVFPLLIAKPLVKGPDTSYEVRSCIAAFVPFLSDEQIKAIEETLFEIYGEDRGSTLSQALSRIPAEKLQLQRSKGFLEQYGQRENVPPIQLHSSVETFTTDMWLEERGVDLKDETNRAFSVMGNELEALNSRWMNSNPPKEALEPTMTKVKTAFFGVVEKKELLPADLYASVLRECVKTAAVLCRCMSDFSKDDAGLLEEIIIVGYQTVSSTDLQYEEEDKSPSHGWGPTVRTDAADAWVDLYVHFRSEKLLGFLIDALRNKNGIVRFMVVKRLILLADINYDKYWELITERLENETDSFVYAGLIGNLKFEPPIIQQQGPLVVNLIEEHVNFFSSDSFLERYVELLLWLMRKHNVARAEQILYLAYDKPMLCKFIIFEVFEKSNPSWPQNNFKNNPDLFKKEFALILHYVTVAGENLLAIAPGELSQQNEIAKQAFKTIDEVILRIFFQLEAKRIRNSNHTLPINYDNRRVFYFLIKPIYNQVIDISSRITGQGLITGHTAHYFIQSLSMMLSEDPKDILEMITKITRFSINGGYTFDSYAMSEMIKLTEKLLADHRDLLMEEEAFKNVIDMLDIYINSGWVDALDLLWKLDEVFR